MRKAPEVGIGELTHRLAAETADADLDETQGGAQDSVLVQLVNKMILDAIGHDPRVEVTSFQGLMVNYARERGLGIVLRGLRAVSDFEYEFQLANMNRKLDPSVDTVFMMTGEDYFYISSQLVREVATFGGNLDGLVPESVAHALRRKFDQSR